MEIQKENFEMLDLMVLPAFCVKNHEIIKVNPAAQALGIHIGTPFASLLQTGAEEYAAFHEGCLYLRLSLEEISYGASVNRMSDGDVFLLDPHGEESELRAMALAAKELRQPLNNLVAIAGSLLPASLPMEDAKTTELLARMNRGLYQLQRLVGNMSDAGLGDDLYHPEVRNIAQVFDDIFEKAAHLVECAGGQLTFEGLRFDVYGLIDSQLMERAVLNLLSNALKFSESTANIHGKLTRSGSLLRLTITDNGSAIGDDILGSVFSRYLRQPGLEDSRHGIGLGMVLVRSAAASHGGTVLLQRPSQGGTQVSLTMKLQQGQQPHVRSPIADLSGGRDQGLIELADCLPVSAYEKE